MKHRMTNPFVYVGIIVILCITLFPVMWMVSTAFKHNSAVFDMPPQWIPVHPTLSAFSSVLHDYSGFLTYMGNSFLVCTLSTILTIAASSIAGYAFSRYRYRGLKSLLILILATQMIPSAVLLLPLYVMYQHFGLLNSYLGLILVYTTFSLPFAIWMMKGFYDTVPKELEEAAWVDGMGKFGTLFRITLRLVTPGIMAVALFSFLTGWNDLMFALTFNTVPSLRTIPPGIQLSYVGQYMYYWSSMMAASVIITIPIVILFIFFQRYLVKGLTMGAVKG